MLAIIKLFISIIFGLLSIIFTSSITSDCINCTNKIGGNTNFIENIKKKAIEQINHFKPIIINKTSIDHLIENQSGIQSNIVGYIIKDGNVSIDNYLFNNLLQKNKEIKNINTKYDERFDIVYKMIQNTLIYAKKQKYKIPDTYFMVFSSDHSIWNIPDRIYMEEVLKMPIFCLAKPIDDNHPLFPDTTFEVFDMNEKYGKNNQVNWENTMKIIDMYIKNYNMERQDKLYFKGSLTGQKSYNLRNNLLNYSNEKHNNNLEIIQLNDFKDFTPPYEWFKYKYLLNLPGHYPWSNRLKYLLLLDSIVINIELKSIKYSDSTFSKIDYKDNKYMSFIDLFIDNSLYINYVYENVSYNNNNGKEEYIDQEKKIKDLYEFLCNHIDKLNKDKKYYKLYFDKGQKAKNILHKINQDAIYEFIYTSIVENSKIITYNGY